MRDNTISKQLEIKARSLFLREKQEMLLLRTIALQDRDILSGCLCDRVEKLFLLATGSGLT